MGSLLQSGARLSRDKILSTGRLLTVCEILLLVSIGAGVSLKANEHAEGGTGSQAFGQPSAPASQLSARAATRLLPPPEPGCGPPRLPLAVATTTGDRQLDAQAIQALLREVEANHKEANAKLEFYSYILKQTEHQLNDQGERTKYRVHEYRVFPRGQGLTVAAMLSENGKELSPEKLAKEKARANKEWLKHKKDSPKISDSKTVPWFETLDFTVLPPERLEERDVMVLSFRPRADYSPKENGDKSMSGLKGRIWIDPTEKMTRKFQAELTRDFSTGGLSGWLSSLKPGTALTIENMRLGNGLWVVKRFDFSSIAKARGFLMLPNTSRFRFVDEMSDYRPFDPEAKDLFLKEQRAVSSNYRGSERR